MTRTITLEGDVNAADTATNLTAQGSVGSPSLTVPTGVSRISAIYVSGATDFAAAGAMNYLLRIGGQAVKNGEQVITFGGAGGQAPQSGADAPGSTPFNFKLVDADIAVSANDTLQIQAEAAGSDLGDAHVVVTVVFS